MDKNQVYCRYCGKLIDEDASFALIVENNKKQMTIKKQV